MFNRAAAVLLLFTMFSAGVAQAQVTPLIFERESIRIESPSEPLFSGKTETAKDPILPVAPPHAPFTYDVEIRPEDALRLEYIHSLNELNDTTGVMIAFGAPSMVSLPVMQTPTPVDAFFIAKDGTILQIYPNVVLANLKQEVMAPVPVKAFLFLRSGSAAARGIRPHDVVVSKKFVAAPPLIK